MLAKSMSSKQEICEIFTDSLYDDVLSKIISYLPCCCRCKSIKDIHEYPYLNTNYDVILCNNCASYLSEKHGIWWTGYIDKPQLISYDGLSYDSE